MSSKGSILYTSDGTHIFYETHAPTDLGLTVYWEAFWKEYKSVKIEDGNLKIKLWSGRPFDLPIEDLFDIEINAEGFEFGIKPGTPTYNLVCSIQDLTI